MHIWNYAYGTMDKELWIWNYVILFNFLEEDNQNFWYGSMRKLDQLIFALNSSIQLQSRYNTKCYVCQAGCLYMVLPHWAVNIEVYFSTAAKKLTAAKNHGGKKINGCRPRRSCGRLSRVLKLHFPSINFQRGLSAFLKYNFLRRTDKEGDTFSKTRRTNLVNKTNM